jgi:hypothetical protein
MKLYKIWQDKLNGYDTYDSAVVCAESEKDAITINVSGEELLEESDINFQFLSWAPPQFVSAKYLGEATKGIKRDVIVASFNAG